ncbi:MAG: acyl-ACP--UDP-N-acetylglucosamine O-acyltransferase [Alphaproteobacteria bacterium]|nr:acyl-ACP--UDP-N-acetylglucosamine O-acyltransferase [Alphaproteobacteria bacterium]
MSAIHATAVVEPGARVGDNVTIGPYSVVGSDVELGDGVRIHSHVVIAGRTRIGPNCEIFPFAVLGHRPQDLKYKGEPSELLIGANNVIREHVTMHPGTTGGGMVTRIGDNNLFMVGVHVAHDCVIGNKVIMANCATLGGHVQVGDHSVLGGLSAVHQFVRIGKHAMVGGMSGVENDLIPFGSATGERARLSGLNIVGMKRRGFSREEIHALRAAFKLIFSAEEGTIAQRIEDVTKVYEEFPSVLEVCAFLKVDSARAVLQPKSPDAL